MVHIIKHDHVFLGVFFASLIISPMHLLVSCYKQLLQTAHHKNTCKYMAVICPSVYPCIFLRQCQYSQILMVGNLTSMLSCCWLHEHQTNLRIYYFVRTSSSCASVVTEAQQGSISKTCDCMKMSLQPIICFMPFYLLNFVFSQF